MLSALTLPVRQRVFVVRGLLEPGKNVTVQNLFVLHVVELPPLVASRIIAIPTAPKLGNISIPRGIMTYVLAKIYPTL